MEQLVALRPDLVVVSEYTDADFLKQLERSGLRVHRMLGLDSLAGVRGAILGPGPRGRRGRGGAPARRRATTPRSPSSRRRLAGRGRPRVLYWSGDMTAGADTAIGALIEAAGAVNVGREMGVVGIAPPGRRARVRRRSRRRPGRHLARREGRRCTTHPLLSQLRGRARGAHRRAAAPSCWWRSRQFTRGRGLAARAPAASRSGAGGSRPAAVTESARRLVIPALARRAAAGAARWPRPRAACRCRSAACVGALARELGLPGDASALGADRRDDPVDGAPAARAAGGARRRRPGRRRAPCCRPCSATRWPTPACSAWARARRSAPCSRVNLGLASARLPGAAARGLRGRDGGRARASTRSPHVAGAPALHGLLLTGIAVSALAGAGTSVLLVATEEFRVKTVLFWLAGGLEGRGWTHVQAGRRVRAGRRALLLVLLSRPLDVLSLGEEEAASLGLPVHATRLGLLGARLARGRAPARRSPGAVPFVGLMAPHALRPLVGPLGRRLLPAAFLGGALLVVLADLARAHAQHALRPAARRAHRLRGRALLPARAARERGARMSGRDCCSRRARSRSSAAEGACCEDVTLDARARARRSRSSARTRPASRRWCGRSRACCEPRPGRCGCAAARSPPGRATRCARALALVTSRDEGPDSLSVADRVALGRYPHRGPFRPLARGRRGGRRARDRADRHQPPGRAPARHALGGRAAARGARARPRAGAAGAAARRAGGAPRRRPPAPAVPRARRGAARRGRRCWPWSTTWRARPPGPSACCWWRAAGSRPRARRPRCSRARPRKRPSASRSAALRRRWGRKALALRGYLSPSGR